jgi:hypothetical protein
LIPQFGKVDKQLDYTLLALTQIEKNILLVLDKLDLIKYDFTSYELKIGEDGKIVHMEKCGMLLTKFGYSFIDCLENPTK